MCDRKKDKNIHKNSQTHTHTWLHASLPEKQKRREMKTKREGGMEKLRRGEENGCQIYSATRFRVHTYSLSLSLSLSFLSLSLSSFSLSLSFSPFSCLSLSLFLPQFAIGDGFFRNGEGILPRRIFLRVPSVGCPSLSF